MKRILIVEDDVRMLTGLSKMLSKDGYLIETTNDGREAIKKAREGYDLIITDLKMPGVDGMEVLAKVKGISPRTNIIMITGYATVENAIEALKKGARDYICKPFDPQELRDSVRMALDDMEYENSTLRSMPKGVFTQEELDAVMDALKSSFRRRVLELLYEGGCSYTKLYKELKLKDPTKLNYHLKLLRSAGLIEQDEERIYHLSDRGNTTLLTLENLKRND